MIRITDILGNSMCCCSGGCHSSDFVNIIQFSNGTSIKINRCSCGNGCHGSFPINRLKINMEFDDIQDFYQQFPSADSRREQEVQHD